MTIDNGIWSALTAMFFTPTTLKFIGFFSICSAGISMTLDVPNHSNPFRSKITQVCAEFAHTATENKMDKPK